MTSTFWINSYLRAALPAIAATGFNGGLALNISMNNVTGTLAVVAVLVMAIVSKISFSHLSSKEDYLWFLGDDAKKSRLVVGYARLVGVGIFLGTSLMSIAQYGEFGTMIFAVFVLSWILLSEGFKFDKTVKSLEE